MKTLKKIILSILILLSAGVISVYGQNSGSIHGVVKDKGGETIVGAVIFIIDENKGTATDINGEFILKPLEAGQYDLRVSFTGLQESILRGVTVEPGQRVEVNFTLKPLMNVADVVRIEREYVKPPVDPKYTSMHTIPLDIFTNMALEPANIEQAISNVCATCNIDAGGSLIVRGARAGTVQYIVDGEKLFRNSDVPGLSILQVSVLTGGIPAEFGDVTGGVVIVNTKDYKSGMFYKKRMEREVRQRIKIREQVRKGIPLIENE